MATIEKRETSDGTKYRVKVRIKGHISESETFDNESDAKFFAIEREKKIRQGEIGEDEDRYVCKRCGAIEDLTGKTWKNGGLNGTAADIGQVLWYQIIFAGKIKPKEIDWTNFCTECAKKVTPVVYKMRDVVELRTFVSKLERAIRERKRQIIRPNKDHRAVADAISKLRQIRSAGRNGYFPC